MYICMAHTVMLDTRSATNAQRARHRKLDVGKRLQSSKLRPDRQAHTLYAADSVAKGLRRADAPSEVTNRK